jgi:membrane-associated protease RseP (regulator of RpoE activity)
VRIPSGDGGSNAELAWFWLGAPLHSLAGEEFSAFGVGKDDGGVQLVKVPAGSAAAAAGLRDNDLVQRVNGRKVSNIDELFAALNAAASTPLELRVVRHQKPVELKLKPVPFIGTETAGDAKAFQKLVPSPLKSPAFTTSGEVGNMALPLGDGLLAKDYGPVFPNGVHLGAYKLDLGAVQSIAAVSSWSFNQHGNRGRQRVTIYGSNSATDPGWNLSDAGKFTPLGSIDTASLPAAPFTAASLRAPSGGTLGSFRWIVWAGAPVTDLKEHTAWQEFSVERAD